MKFRKSEVKDIEAIMEIIKQAQDYLKDENIDQWQNNYPNKDIIKEDIDKGYSYILEDEGRILGTTALSFDGEPTYKLIEDGQWLTNDDYGVIHRIAVDLNLRGRGIGGDILDEVQKISRDRGIFSLKIDTHRKNKSMIKFLEKNGFKYCGIIYLKDGNERVAFEKLME